MTQTSEQETNCFFEFVLEQQTIQDPHGYITLGEEIACEKEWGHKLVCETFR